MITISSGKISGSDGRASLILILLGSKNPLSPPVKDALLKKSSDGRSRKPSMFLKVVFRKGRRIIENEELSFLPQIA